jgi:putative hydrolase of the HAD superfamily
MDGLLIDWGGVLTHSVLGSFEAFCERERLPSGAVLDALGDHLLEDLETGDLPLARFEARLARKLGLDPTNLAARLMEQATPDHAMREAVRHFHDAGVRTVLVSNSWRRSDYDMDDAFDAIVLSQQLGIRKPDRRIYETALERAELPASRCVFVDDLGANLKPARALGMTTIKHEHARKTISQLKGLLSSRPS